MEISWHEQLRNLREESGISLQEVADRTRIGMRHLEALERGDIQALPGTAFTRGFIRAVCSEIGCDPAPVLRMLDDSLEEEAPEEVETYNGGGRRLRLPLLLTGALLVLLLLGGLFLHGEKDEGERSAPEDRTGTNESAQTAARAAEFPQVNVPAAVNLPQYTPDLDLTISAIERTWLRIVTDNGEAWEATLAAGDELRLRATDSINLVIGNAGGITFDLNGKVFGPPGQTGQVVSNYIITRDNL